MVISLPSENSLFSANSVAKSVAVNVSVTSSGSRGRCKEKQKCLCVIAVSLRLPELQSQNKSSKILNSVTGEMKPELNHNAWNYDTVTCMGGFQSCVLFQGQLEPGDFSREGGAHLQRLIEPALSRELDTSRWSPRTTFPALSGFGLGVSPPATWPWNKTAAEEQEVMWELVGFISWGRRPPAPLAARDDRTPFFPPQ